MALDSVPPYPCDLGSSSRAAAARTQQRIRKDERTWTSDTYAPYDDGHQWRKYGEKKLSISNFPRFYYRCTYKNDMKCPATKQVQQKDTSDPPLFSATYFNHHTCSTSSSAVGSARDIASQSSSNKAVSICFSPHAASEQPSFLTSPATPRSPIMHSYSANQQPDRSANQSCTITVGFLKSGSDEADSDVKLCSSGPTCSNSASSYFSSQSKSKIPTKPFLRN
ncbi:transcription factor WRKY45-2-like [Miscanthus floridulus]|uniref:transcription factor WRKY45-2-like n=1 Tax=Miscanthus floridulus TaxID=154761 RepID=UPI00345752AF